MTKIIILNYKDCSVDIIDFKEKIFQKKIGL